MKNASGKQIYAKLRFGRKTGQKGAIRNEI
jgi:hypothetical protein